MYTVMMLSLLGGTGVHGYYPPCGYPPREWCACKGPKAQGGQVVLYFPKTPGVGPDAEQEWMEYIHALETWERPEYMYLWHKADACGKWALLNQVRLMKLRRDLIDQKAEDDREEMKPEDKKEEMRPDDRKDDKKPEQMKGPNKKPADDDEEVKKDENAKKAADGMVRALRLPAPPADR